MQHARRDGARSDSLAYRAALLTSLLAGGSVVGSLITARHGTARLRGLAAIGGALALVQHWRSGLVTVLVGLRLATAAGNDPGPAIRSRLARLGHAGRGSTRRPVDS